MAIFLVQHGRCLSKEEDPRKGLSPRGDEQTRLIAGVAGNYEVPVKKIIHSGKKRARQTAELFREILGVDAQIEQASGISPMDDVVRFSGKIHADDNLMVVGHLPFMERLVGYLTAGDKNCRVCKFQNSGIVCLDSEKEGDWFIKWTLNPEIS